MWFSVGVISPTSILKVRKKKKTNKTLKSLNLVWHNREVPPETLGNSYYNQSLNRI
jgi:hypothetical protein